MLLVFGARSNIGVSLLARAKGSGEPFLSFGRTNSGEGWVHGDLFNPSEIISHLKLKANKKISRIIFCHRYRPLHGQLYSAENEFSLTISGPLAVSRSAFDILPDLRNIVYISSPASQYVSDEQPIGYHFARAALESMVRCLAVEFSGRNIAVNALRIGYIKPSCKKKSRSTNFYSCDSVAVPRGFAPGPDEVAHAIDQISKLESSIITGQTISLDAGLSLRSHATLTERAVNYFAADQN